MNRILQNIRVNSRDTDWLYQYYKGYQPILHRVKPIRPEINNKVVDNVALEIVEFARSYTFGEGVQYVKKGTEGVLGKPNVDDTGPIASLNRTMDIVAKHTSDVELGDWLAISGHAYRMVLPIKEEPGYEIITLDPRNTFVVYSSDFRRRPVLAGTSYLEDTDDGRVMEVYTIYTSLNETFELRIEAEVSEVLPKQISEAKKNTLKSIPIIEYIANPSRMGRFEPAIELMNALNEAHSNRLDGIAQFIQSLIVFKNCQISQEGIEEIKAHGAVSIESKHGTADIEILSEELDQIQVQHVVDSLYDRILTICGIPDRRMLGGGNTGTSLEIGQGWVDMENRAKSLEALFIKSENRLLTIILDILKTKKKSEYESLEVTDIEIKFTRNKSANLLIKTQGLFNMLNAGIHPRISISVSSLFSDPEEVYQESLVGGYLEKWKYKEPDRVDIDTKTPANSNPRTLGLHSVDDGVTARTALGQTRTNPKDTV